MTSRERILTALAHQEPDQVPVDLGATPSSGISAIAYGNLKRHLNIKEGRTEVYDVVQQLAQPEPVILDFFGVDVIDLGRVYNRETSAWHETRLADGSAAFYPSWFNPVQQPDGSWDAVVNGVTLARMPDQGTFFDQACFPYLDGYPENYKKLDQAMDTVLWAAFPTPPWDHTRDPNFWQELRKQAIALRESTDRAIMIGAGCNLFEWGTFLRRMDNFLMDLVLDPAGVEKLLDALMERHLETLKTICQAVGDVVDIVRFGDDLGMDNGPFMAPVTYQNLFKSRHTLLCDTVKKNSQMHTYLHSCGSIYKLLPDLIDAGFEVINPVQTSTKDMEPDKLKKEFGKDIVFWGGGADTRAVLNRATPEEVKTHVLERLEIFSPGGGYVFNTVHNILPEVPPENIVAMVDAINSFNGK